MLGSIILCLHDMDGMNLFSMLPQGGSVLKSLAAHVMVNRDFKVLVDMHQHYNPCLYAEKCTVCTDNLCAHRGNLIAQVGYKGEWPVLG